MNDEAEMAGVLGHEVGHVAAEHGRKRQRAARRNSILGVLGQIGFIILVIFGARAIGGNFAANASRLGEAQFICRDGSFSYRCAYDFMDSEAGFPISDTVLEYEEADSFWYAFYMGVLNTLKVAILGVILTAMIGTIAGIALPGISVSFGK